MRVNEIRKMFLATGRKDDKEYRAKTTKPPFKEYDRCDISKNMLASICSRTIT